MKTNDRKRFCISVEALYSRLITPLYIEWQDLYTTAEIRLELVHWMNCHNHTKVVELLRKRNGRSKRTKKIKEELRLLKVANELEEFTKNL